MNNGYIKIHRCLMSKGYYKDSEYVHLWLHLIMKATYQDREYLFNNQVHQLSAGQLICGRKSLALETGISESKVERILKCFESEQQIEQQKNNKFRIISITNWNQYQQDEQQIGQQMDNQRTTSEQPVNTNNKEKKYKKVKYINNITADKKLFLDSVFLTEQEHQKLVDKYSDAMTNQAIEILNNAIMSKGYKYKSHYHTLIGWPMREAKGEGNNGNGNGSRFITGSTGTAIKKTGYAQSDGEPWPEDHVY